MNQSFLGSTYEDENDKLSKDLKEINRLNLRYAKYIIMLNDM